MNSTIPNPAAPERFRPSDAWFADRKVTVMGLGRFGGGLGVTRFLAQRGAAVLLTDTAGEDTLRAPLADLRDLVGSGAVELRLGEHNASDFTTADAVVVNPAVATPWNNRFVRAALAAGVPLLTEIGLLCDRIEPDRVIAVTGTAGKSTTAAMIHHALTACRMPAVLGGNLGGSLLATLNELTPDTTIVLELSSAMLWWLGGPDGAGFACKTAALTNVLDNHLDWHGDAAHYAACKRTLLRAPRGPGAAAILAFRESDWDLPPRVLRCFALQTTEVPALAIPGWHNRLNAAMASVAAAVHVPSLDVRDTVKSIQTFRGLPHRLQPAGRRSGVTFFNDSKCTTPQATRGAIEALAETGARRIHLIAGGYDKGIDLSPMLAERSLLASVSAIGATAGAIAELADSLPDDARGTGDAAEQPKAMRVAITNTLEQAMLAIHAEAEPGDTVLLSPGCASWDQFENFEQRGHRFVELAAELFGPEDPA
ncbi:MAG: Mur ligase family protein [Planctomycetota bacterium]